MFGYICIALGIIVGLVANHYFTKWLGNLFVRGKKTEVIE